MFEVLGCPVCWYGYKNSCYRLGGSSHFGHRDLNWEDARRLCLQHGGDLLSVADNAEMDFIKRISNETVKYWIGLNDRLSENVFVWSDGTLYNRSLYNNWIDGEPNDDKSNEDCVELNNHAWNDFICASNLSYICERPKGQTT